MMVNKWLIAGALLAVALAVLGAPPAVIAVLHTALGVRTAAECRLGPPVDAAEPFGS